MSFKGVLIHNMRTKFIHQNLVPLLITVFLIWGHFSHAAAMSLHLVDADVRYVLTTLAATNNINIVIDDNVTGTVSVNLDDISPIAAMKIIGRIKGLAIEEDDNVFFISDKKIYIIIMVNFIFLRYNIMILLF